MEVLHYLTPTGIDPFQKWLDHLMDIRGRVAILRRVDRLTKGHLGDHKFVGEGVWELRIDVGPGYRVYYARDADALLLLNGGAKRTQTTDITTAIKYWREYRSHD